MTLTKVVLKSIALHILAVLGYLLGLPLLERCRRRKTIRILRYHSVNPHRGHEVNVRPQEFFRQMCYLKKKFYVLSLEKIREIIYNKRVISQRIVALTFDDGYQDNFIFAFPVLQRMHIPATVFLSAGYIGTDHILEHDRNDDPCYNRLLSWEEVLVMYKAGIHFGSHTLHHANLGALAASLQREEILKSKGLIEAHLGASIGAISYPYGLAGNFDVQTQGIAKEAGFLLGCSAMYGFNDASSDIFALRRIGIEASDTMFTFMAKLNGALDLLLIKEKPLFVSLVRWFNRLLGV